MIKKETRFKLSFYVGRTFSTTVGIDQSWYDPLGDMLHPLDPWGPWEACCSVTLSEFEY